MTSRRRAEELLYVLCNLHLHTLLEAQGSLSSVNPDRVSRGFPYTSEMRSQLDLGLITLRITGSPYGHLTGSEKWHTFSVFTHTHTHEHEQSIKRRKLNHRLWEGTMQLRSQWHRLGTSYVERPPPRISSGADYTRTGVRDDEQRTCM